MVVTGETRLRTSLLLTLIASGALLAGCGGATPSSVYTPPSPTATLLAAVTTTTRHSLHADIAVDLTISGSTAITVHANAHIAEESPTRISETVTESFFSEEQQQYLTAYDGTLYTSSDGGGTYHPVLTKTPINDTYNREDALSTLEAVATVTDAGPSTTDGVDVEEYTGTFDKDKLIPVIKGRLQRYGVLNATQLQALNNLTGTLDATIDADGRLVTEDITFDTTVKCGCGRTIEVTEQAHIHYYDYGAAITVQRPAASSVTA